MMAVVMEEKKGNGFFKNYTNVGVGRGGSLISRNGSPGSSRYWKIWPFNDSILC
jgi:hypothetical protein